MVPQPCSADAYALRLLLLVTIAILLWRPAYAASVQTRLQRIPRGIDPWGECYQVTTDPATGWIEVRCLGPDGRSGTADDIVESGRVPR
jgi:hypothetical protein